LVWVVEQAKRLATTYTLHTTDTGIVIAENRNPQVLQRMPVPLPARAEFSIASLRGTVPRTLQRELGMTPSTLKRTDSAEIFRQAFDYSRKSICPLCKKSVTISFGNLQLGHAPWCLRGVMPSPDTQRPTARFGTSGTATPRSEFRYTCKYCGQPLLLLGKRSIGHASTCPLFTTIPMAKLNLAQAHPTAAPASLRLEWQKCVSKTSNQWCSLHLLDLQDPYIVGVQGVYVVWRNIQGAPVLYVGRGNVAQRLAAFRQHARILEYPRAELLVTWARVDAARIDGVCRYLVEHYRPQLGLKTPIPQAAIAVNLPASQ
jgi:hypothetical protein